MSRNIIAKGLHNCSQIVARPFCDLAEINGCHTSSAFGERQTAVRESVPEILDKRQRTLVVADFPLNVGENIRTDPNAATKPLRLASLLWCKITRHLLEQSSKGALHIYKFNSLML